MFFRSLLNKISGCGNVVCGIDLSVAIELTVGLHKCCWIKCFCLLTLCMNYWIIKQQKLIYFLLQNKHKIIPHFFKIFKRSIHTINVSRKYSQGTYWPHSSTVWNLFLSLYLLNKNTMTYKEGSHLQLWVIIKSCGLGVTSSHKLYG